MPDRPPPHSAARFRWFSPARVWALATNTLTQLVRMKVFYFLFIFSAAVVAAAFIFLSWSYEQELKLLKDVALGAMAAFSGLFAIAGTAVLIPKDLEDRTLYTILAKPVPRFEYLFGKLLGVLLLIGLSLVIMQALFSVVLGARENMILEREIARMDAAPPLGIETVEELEAAKAAKRAEIEAQGLNWSLLNATASIFLKATVMASLSLLLSTFASSTLFTIVAGAAVFVIGHFQAMARDYFLAGEAVSGASRLIAVVVAILFPDFKAFDIVDAVTTGEAVPGMVMAKMAGLAVLYVIIYNLAALFVFADKEL